MGVRFRMWWMEGDKQEGRGKNIGGLDNDAPIYIE